MEDLVSVTKAIVFKNCIFSEPSWDSPSKREGLTGLTQQEGRPDVTQSLAQHLLLQTQVCLAEERGRPRREKARTLLSQAFFLLPSQEPIHGDRCSGGQSHGADGCLPCSLPGHLDTLHARTWGRMPGPEGVLQQEGSDVLCCVSAR